VLGYDDVDKRLVVNEAEAEQVRAIFAHYLELGSLLAVVDELKDRAWTTKSRKDKQGRQLSGRVFVKDGVHALLTNPLYLGKTRVDDELYEGAHDAIVDEATWRLVQERLRSNGGGKAGRGRRRHDALLAGIARCGACGSAMSPHHTKKGAKRYAYYVCTRHQKEGARACPGSRIAAGDFEAFIVERIREIGRDPSVLEATLAADRRDREARQPELIAEARRLSAEKTRLENERRNIVEAIAQGGKSASVLLRHLAEMDEDLERIGARAVEVRDELQALELGGIDAADLREAITDLDAIWGELFPRERARVLALLIEEVRYDAPRGEVEIVFRAGGPRALRNGRPEGTR
jgi:site-specific DNA recombinase